MLIYVFLSLLFQITIQFWNSSKLKYFVFLFFSLLMYENEIFVVLLRWYLFEALLIPTMKNKLTFFFVLLLSAHGLSAMNVKSLEITYENITQLSYRANVIFYLYDPSPVDSQVALFWGDNTNSTLTVSSITDLPGELKRVTYSGTHTYSGPSTFTMYVSYKVRSLNVNNIPNSLATDIYAEAKLVVSPFLSGIKSPVFMEKPRLNVCRGQNETVNFSAFDASGDVLKYSIIPCRGEDGTAITGYTNPSTSSTFSIDANSGWLLWDSPLDKGFFNYAVLVEKYRNGVFLGSIMRDVLVNVIDCSPQSPLLEVFNDTCVLAGTLLHDTVRATYAGIDTISLTAIGEPLLLTSTPATFPQPVRNRYSVYSVFDWNVSCEHVRPEPYKLLFKADLEDSLSTCDCSYDFETSVSPFYANVHAIIGQPCGPGWDNSNYLWFGADSAAPRFVATPVLNVSSGNFMMVFDLRMAEHTGNPGTDCEGPDEPDEGIYLQYSLNGLIGPWVTMAYWDPSLSPGEGGHVANLINWNNYSVVVPEGAISTATRFRWMQFESTGIYYDHWGIDNVNIYKISDKTPAQKEVNISVIAPAPENLTASPAGNNAYLQWNKEICSEAAGYFVYRKAGSSGYVPSGCETGVPAYTGYVKIATLSSINDTTYTDSNNGLGLPHGNTYCYMVTAWFANGSESQASNEACVQMPDDEPVITNVSVETTSATAGTMFLAWSKPDDFDTLIYTGPFRYDIYRSNGFAGSVYSFVSSNSGLNDTTFTDTGLNTSGGPWHYRIDLMYAAGGTNYTLFSSSYPASSVFLSITPSDQSLLLEWDYNVPWNNDSTVIYRYNPSTFVFDSIGLSFNKEYIDTGLTNGVEYCYKVETIGSYSLSGFKYPLRNFSQELCERPQDIVPPCPVVLSVEVDCEEVSNHLTWTSPANQCGDFDVGGYIIYYSLMPDGEFTYLDSIDNIADTFYTHFGETSVAGCFAVVAFDTVGNYSNFSNIVCVDIDECDLYQLPNVFTPNGDGFNDYFIPFPYDFVEKIDLTIFDRWGLEVFKTEDPDIMWDGRNQSNSLECAEGVYYYVCDVYEMRLAGIRKRTLTGTVHLYRNK